MELRRIGELLLEEAPAPGRPAHLGTASGLVHCGGRVYAVADDEPVLGVFDRPGERPGRVIALDPAPLPLEHAARKAAKPDLESLCVLPGARGRPGGALLTLGSGSTETRQRGWVADLDESGGVSGQPVEVSLAPLYSRLRQELPDLNIEGAAVTGDSLWLAQRGNGAHGFNALVRLALPAVLDAVHGARPIPADAVRGHRRWELGQVDGVPLTFSDLAPAGDGLLAFCAVCEAVESTYLDGPCVGAAVGVLDPELGELRALAELAEPHKLEGISPTGPGAFLLVEDPDTSERPAPLFAGSL